METEIKKAIDLIEKAQKIGFITHKDGDGDGFGAMLALARVLENAGKKTIVFSNEALPQIFDFIENKIEYHPKNHYQKVNLLIGFDANALDWFTLPEIFKEARKDGAKILVLDHHIPMDITKVADFYWNEPEISCVCEMVFELIKAMGLRIDKATATLLLIGIETDTFSLQFTNTKPQTFRTVAELLKLGARLKPVVESTFGGRPIVVVKMLGRAIERLDLDKKSGIAITYITNEDISELELSEQASSGVANFLDQIKEAKVVAVLVEREPGNFKVSLRSNNSDKNVAKVAESFGGGGHKKAAGFEIEGDLQEVLERVRKKLLT